MAREPPGGPRWAQVDFLTAHLANLTWSKKVTKQALRVSTLPAKLGSLPYKISTGYTDFGVENLTIS